MPYEGSYHIGPRQQISAIILGGMFVLLFLTMQTVTNSGVSRETSIFVVVPWHSASSTASPFIFAD